MGIDGGIEGEVKKSRKGRKSEEGKYRGESGEERTL
jgi:hypothetical protein